MNAKAVILCLLLKPMAVCAQGFAGLGSVAQDGFATPSSQTVMQFPRDHGAHPDYRIEWWYVTANVQGQDGTQYGLQWTLFRNALAPYEALGWQSPQMWMGHAAITTPSAQFTAERLARGGIGQAGVTFAPFQAWVDNWTMAGRDLNRLNLTASGPNFAYDMALTAKGPLVLHGQAGYSVKSFAGQASYYYSQPFYDITGTLHLPSGDVSVTGKAWLDHEWSSQPLAADQTGWDWFSLSFESGAKLMGFVLRGDSHYTSATWIAPDGQATPIPNGAFTANAVGMHRVSGRDIPVKWHVQLPSHGVDVTVSALNDDAWMATSVPYWEGPVTLSGSHSGSGYLEMTGYEN